MKKVIIFLFLLILVGIGAYVGVKRFVGDLRPVLLPVVKTVKKVPAVSPKRGLPLGIDLKLPAGYTIGLFAKDLGGVRDITFSPNGTMVVSVPSGHKILALPDKDGDGVADDAFPVLTNLRNPHGVAFYKDKLYVASERDVSRYIWAEEDAAGGLITVARLDKKLFDLPEGGRHKTRSLAFDTKGTLYVVLGSTCDVCVEKQPFISTVIVSDAEGKTPRIFAKGLRNSVFVTIQPGTSELWGTEMGRDFLGDVTPPDEINLIKDNQDYGWPYCYGNKIYDTQFGQKTPAYCQNTQAPIYEIPAHSAPLGLTFIQSAQFPTDWQGDLFVSYHGSWNSSTPVGYKVVHMKVTHNTISGEEDFLTGFLQGGGAVGRPVDVEFDKSGNLFVSDDKAGSIYVISKE
jgi:glucose/arabinose dehydrogenase